jgi:hypothetical protein
MVKVLGLRKSEAVELKALMEDGYIKRTLTRASVILDGCGVEYLVPNNNTQPIAYVNMGDTYSTTLLFDHHKNRFVIGSWGDLVEAQPRRFAN